MLSLSCGTGGASSSPDAEPVGSGGTPGTGGSLASGGAFADAATDVPRTGCPALPAPTGTVVNVTAAQAATPHTLTLNAAAGTTFVLAPGNCAIAGPLRLEKPGMTLRSATDRAADAVIDAADSVAEAIVIRASNATVAHVTVTHAVDHAIHVSPASEGADVTGLLVCGVALTDNGEQFLKVNPLGTAAVYIDGGRVECSSFLLTQAGRRHIERSTGGCYVPPPSPYPVSSPAEKAMVSASVRSNGFRLATGAGPAVVILMVGIEPSAP